VVIFKSLSLHPRGKSSRYPMDRRLGRPQSRFERCGEEKKILHYWESNPGRPVRSLPLYRLPNLRHTISQNTLPLCVTIQSDIHCVRVRTDKLFLTYTSHQRLTSQTFLTGHCMEISGELHVQTALLSRNTPLIFNGQEVGWTPEPA
jgi:hypothetical protein